MLAGPPDVLSRGKKQQKQRVGVPKLQAQAMGVHIVPHRRHKDQCSSAQSEIALQEGKTPPSRVNQSDCACPWAPCCHLGWWLWLCCSFLTCSPVIKAIKRSCSFPGARRPLMTHLPAALQRSLAWQATLLFDWDGTFHWVLGTSHTCCRQLFGAVCECVQAADCSCT